MTKKVAIAGKISEGIKKRKTSFFYYPNKFVDEILREPFEVTELDFKVKSRTKDDKDKGSFLTYVDTRAVERRMNIVFGPDWEAIVASSYHADDRIVTVVNVNVFNRVTREMRTFSNVGEKHCNFKPSASEARDRDGNAATSSYAQAFKRACTKLGIGEYIYRLSGEKDQWVEIKWNKPVITDEVIRNMPRFMFPVPINERLLRLAGYFCELDEFKWDAEKEPYAPVTYVQEVFNWNKGMSDEEKLYAEAQLAWALDDYMM